MSVQLREDRRQDEAHDDGEIWEQAMRPARISDRYLWGVSLAMSLGLLATLIFVWWDVSAHPRGRGIGTPVHTKTEADRHLAQEAPKAKYRIPTGTFIESVEFLSGHNVKVTGYVWQRYGPGVPRQVTRGVVLPEADNSYLKTPVYRHRDGQDEVLGWYFKVTIRERFDYRRYPLDRQDLWLRMWHPDFGHSIILTPDFESYPRWRNAHLNGLDSQFLSDSWDAENTGFSFVRNPYTTSFGFGTTPKSSRPELYFNVQLARSFAGPLFENLIPLVFIALLVFAALFLTTMNGRLRELFGFSTFAVVGFASSTLMVVAVRHAAVRESMNADGIVYLEYFIFAVYVAILIVAFNAVAVTSGLAPGILRWRENLLPRIAYWPGILGSLVLASLLVLY